MREETLRDILLEICKVEADEKLVKDLEEASETMNFLLMANEIAETVYQWYIEGMEFDAIVPRWINGYGAFSDIFAKEIEFRLSREVYEELIESLPIETWSNKAKVKVATIHAIGKVNLSNKRVEGDVLDMDDLRCGILPLNDYEY